MISRVEMTHSEVWICRRHCFVNFWMPEKVSAFGVAFFERKRRIFYFTKVVYRSVSADESSSIWTFITYRPHSISSPSHNHSLRDTRDRCNTTWPCSRCFARQGTWVDFVCNKIVRSFITSLPIRCLRRRRGLQWTELGKCFSSPLSIRCLDDDLSPCTMIAQLVRVPARVFWIPNFWPQWSLGCFFYGLFNKLYCFCHSWCPFSFSIYKERKNARNAGKR